MHNIKNRFPAICLFIGLALAFQVPAIANALTLADLQEKSIARRKTIDRYRLDVQYSEEDRTISRSPFWPSLDLRYTANALDEDTALENSKNSELVGSVSYNLFSGFRDRHLMDAYDQIKLSKEFALQNIIQDIKYQVAIRYLAAYRAQNQLIVARDEVALLQKRYRDAKNRYDVGLIRRNELLKIRVQMDDSLQKMKTAEADLKKSIHYLEFETESRIDEASLGFNEFLSLPEVREIEHYRSLLATNRSEVKALEALQTSRTYQTNSLKSAYYPSVDVSASYSKYGDDFVIGLDEGEEDETRLTLDVTMNLFAGNRYGARISQSKLEAKQIADDIHELKQRLETDLKSTFIDFQVARSNLAVAESSVAQAEENLRITDASFKEGIETATDVLDAVLNVSRAKFNAIHSRSDVFAQYYQLMRLVENL